MARLLFAAACLVLTSCSGGPKVHPVRGSVLYLDQPTAGATVVFQPIGGEPEVQVPSGVVGADGTFTLQAPAGEYVVVITWYPPDAREQVNPRNQLPGRYSNAADSPLRATVEARNNELAPFRLTK